MKEQYKKLKNNKKNILVIDDEKLICVVLSDWLKEQGFAVVPANDGESGWEMYKKIKPDLVLTDLRMPGINGFELLKKIREKDKKTPVIIITGFGTSEITCDILQHGADGLITKPFQIDELLSIIARALRLSEHEREITNLRNLNNALLEENKRLKEKISKGTETIPDKYRYMVGAIFHSLKSEFMHIGGSIQNLQEFTKSSKDVQEEYEIITRSLQYSQLLMRRLIDFLDLGKPLLKQVDITEIVHRTESLVRPRLPSNIELIINYCIDKRLIYADAEQLMEVLLELIQNAIKALHEKGGSIHLQLEERDNQFALSVRDDGPGIPVEIREELFKKVIKSEKGSGIGLFLCSKIMQELGGALYLEDTSKKGTTFKILMPATYSAKES